MQLLPCRNPHKRHKHSYLDIPLGLAPVCSADDSLSLQAGLFASFCYHSLCGSVRWYCCRCAVVGRHGAAAARNGFIAHRTAGGVATCLPCIPAHCPTPPTPDPDPDPDLDPGQADSEMIYLLVTGDTQRARSQLRTAGGKRYRPRRQHTRIGHFAFRVARCFSRRAWRWNDPLPT